MKTNLENFIKKKLCHYFEFLYEKKTFDWTWNPSPTTTTTSICQEFLDMIEKEDNKIHTGDTKSLDVCGQKHRYMYFFVNPKPPPPKKKNIYIYLIISHVTCHLSHFMCHTSHVTCEMSCVSSHLSPTPTTTATDPPLHSTMQ